MKYYLSVCLLVGYVCSMGCTHVISTSDQGFLGFSCGMQRNKADLILKGQGAQRGLAFSQDFYAGPQGQAPDCRMLVALVKTNDMPVYTLYLVFGKNEALTSVWTSDPVFQNPPLCFENRCGDGNDAAVIAKEIYGVDLDVGDARKTGAADERR